MILNSNDSLQQHAEYALTHLLFSSTYNEKKNGIAILHKVKDSYSHPDHISLIEHPDSEIAELAINAIGKTSDAKTIRVLFSKISTHEKAVLEALYEAGETSVPLIQEQLAGGFMNARIQEKLITLLGKIGGENANNRTP